MISSDNQQVALFWHVYHQRTLEKVRTRNEIENLIIVITFQYDNANARCYGLYFILTLVSKPGIRRGDYKKYEVHI